MEEYNNAVLFCQKENISKKDIFLYAKENNNTSSILGLIDGLILRDNNINVLNGLIKQYIKLLDEEDLILSIEHACLLHKEYHVKTISNFISNNILYLDIYQYIRKKDINSIKYIEPFIEKLNIIVPEFLENEDTKSFTTFENEDTKSFTTFENDIKNINININNLNINIYNLQFPNNDYFNKITQPNIIDL